MVVCALARVIDTQIQNLSRYLIMLEFTYDLHLTVVVAPTEATDLYNDDAAEVDVDNTGYLDNRDYLVSLDLITRLPNI